MTSGSGVIVLNNEVKGGGVIEKVTFGRELKVMRKQSIQMSM